MPERHHHQPLTTGQKTTFPFLLILWAAFCLFAGMSLIRAGMSTKGAFEAKEKATQALKEEELKGIELQKKVDNADTPLSQEKIIREQLHMQKPDEKVLLLPSPSP